MTSTTITDESGNSHRFNVLTATETPEEVKEERGVFHTDGRKDPIVIRGEARVIPAHGTITIDLRDDRTWEALQQLTRSRAPVDLALPGEGSRRIRLSGPVDKRTEEHPDGNLVTVSAVYNWQEVKSY